MTRQTDNEQVSGNPEVSLVLMALALAQQPNPKKATFLEKENRFNRDVEMLVQAPGFSSAKAETAAEFLKSQSMHSEYTWVRFGLRTGTYISLLPLFFLLQQQKDLAVLPVLATFVVYLFVFFAGLQNDTFQSLLKHGESIAKAAAKQKMYDNNLPQIEIDTSGVQIKLNKLNSSTYWLALFGLIIFVAVALMYLVRNQ